MRYILQPFLKPLNILLLLIPVAVVAEIAHWNPALAFGTAALAVVPLSGLLGDATEELASRTGPQIGALINATLGNAAELIITILAIRQGLLDLVRASIVGSIIGNILLVLGAAFVLGGLKNGIQKFNPSQAGLNATLLLMAAVVLAVPSLFAFAIEPDTQRVEELSLLTAVAIIVMYALSVVYTLRARAGDPLAREAARVPTMSLPFAIGLLIVATTLIALMSELLVGAVEPMTAQLGISEIFVGIILVPIIGNIAEHVVAIEVAMKDQMDLSLGIAIGSSLQVALLVAPLLVFVALLFGQYLTLEFTTFELVALIVSCVIASVVSMDGRSNWLEGVLLIGVYLILAIAFFFLPAAPA